MLELLDLTNFRHRLSTKAATRALPIDELIGPERLAAILAHGVPAYDTQRILARDLAEVLAAVAVDSAGLSESNIVIAASTFESLPGIGGALEEHGVRWLSQASRRNWLVDQGFSAWLVHAGEEARLETFEPGREWFLDARDLERLERRCLRRLGPGNGRRIAVEGSLEITIEGWISEHFPALEISRRCLGTLDEPLLLVDIGHRIDIAKVG